MGFLGQAIRGGAKYLGRAVKGAQFLGRNLNTISAGLSSANRFIANPSVQALAQKAGVPNSVFTTLGRVGDTVGAGLDLVPGVAGNVRSAAGALAPAKRSIAELYQQARGAR